MTIVSALSVKELRDKTGAGMADCKKALEESGGEMDAAIEYLRKRGAASVAKRADRDAKEGIILARTFDDGKKSIILEVNCETDFVARNEEFVAFANAIADALVQGAHTSEDELWNSQSGGKSLANLRDEILAKFSEKIGLKRFEHLSTEGCFTSYIHAGNRLAVLVEFNAAPSDPEHQALMRDIAMQVAAMQPMFVDRNAVDTGSIEKELDIYRQQAITEGKPADIADRIATGRLEKFYQEQVLTEQTFVKDPALTVADVLKKIGDSVKAVTFRRFALGEK